ncbi:WhiB family transcriptional regulator [Streptomyces diastatochromogenes]|nr:WhiB family transcriptional regulator [Streptomyces diastatochromogenes]
MSTTPCIIHADLFRLLEDLSGSGINDQMLDGDQLAMFTDEEADFREALGQARALCAACPMLESCLFAAVTDHAVKGIVAGTTETDRERIRSSLGLAPSRKRTRTSTSWSAAPTTRSTPRRSRP